MLGNYEIDPNRGHPAMKKRQGDAPVFSLYGLNQNGDYRFLAANRRFGEFQWVIKKARVMITRFWDASTFYVVLQTQRPNPDQPIPELPKIDGRTVQPEDDILITARYDKELDDSKNADQEAEIIFIGSIDIADTVDSPQGGITATLQGRDRMKWLMDSTISYNAVTDGNPRRITPSDLEVGDKNDLVPRSDIILELAQRGIGFIPDVNTGCPRSIERGAIQDVSNDNPGEASANEDGNAITQVANPDFHYTSKVDETINLSNINRVPYQYDSQAKANTTLKNPEFHLYVTRPGFSKANEAIGGVGINVVDQTPIDYIKYLAQHEIYPTQLFQDHKNGCLYYTPRLNDTVGLVGYISEKGIAINQNTEAQESTFNIGSFEAEAKRGRARLYRIYYYRPEYLIASGKVDTNEVDPRQQVGTLKEETSSLSVRTDYIVGNAATDDKDDVAIHFRVKPNSWKDKDYPCRFKQIDDESINTVAEAGAIAAAFARVFSRDTRSGMTVIPGDPTISPGECIQIRGSINTQSYTAQEYDQEIQDFLEAQTILNKSIFDLQKQILNGQLGKQKQHKEEALSFSEQARKPGYRGFTSPDSSPSISDSAQSTVPAPDQTQDDYQINNCADADNFNDFMNRSECKFSGKSNKDFLSAQDPPSIYRVESVVHAYNDNQEGYRTELALLSPY